MLIGELSNKSGVPAYSIHYYVKKGLLSPPEKAGKTRAFYSNAHLERLLAIKSIRHNFNFPLSMVRKELGEIGQAGPANKRATGNTRRNPSANRDDKKNLILDAAVELFAKQGYHGTNIRNIADDLGISTGTLYLYFGNKQELLLQSVDRMVSNTIDTVAKSVAQEKDLFKVMYLRSKAFNQSYNRFNETLAQLRAESVSMGRQGQDLIRKIHGEIMRPLMKEIQQAVEQKLIREADIELLVMSFLALIEMICYRLTWDEKYSFDQIYAFVFDLMMNGLTPTINRKVGS